MFCVAHFFFLLLSFSSFSFRKKKKKSINKTADHLNQPRFLFHVVSRDHEPGFGASANGAADIPLQNSIHQFISELKLAGLETAPDLLPYSSQERRQLLLTGCAGLVTQNAQKMKAFQNIIGLKNPETLELACQLFGDVDILGAVSNVEELMKFFEKISRKELRFEQRMKHRTLKFKKDSVCQPNPLSKAFQLWNIVLVIIIVYIVIKTPLDYFDSWPWETNLIFGKSSFFKYFLIVLIYLSPYLLFPFS